MKLDFENREQSLLKTISSQLRASSIMKKNIKYKSKQPPPPPQEKVLVELDLDERNLACVVENYRFEYRNESNLKPFLGIFGL